MDLKVKVLKVRVAEKDKLLKQMREGKDEKTEPDEKPEKDVKSKSPIKKSIEKRTTVHDTDSIDAWKPDIRRWKNGRPGSTTMNLLHAKARSNRYPYSDVQI